jgi:DNA polymerase-1
MGYVTTPFGRRLQVERYEAYKGVNYKIQCTATSDVLKLKLCELAAAGLGPYIVLPVHDEVIFECPETLVPEVRETVAEVMPYHGFSVPLEIDMSEGVDSWGEAK